MNAAFGIKAEYAPKIRWSKRGSCGQSGCTDPECGCALCGKPIGVGEDDPRWEDHDEFCGDCELCRDQVPLILFRGKGRKMLQAQFCSACVQQMIEVNPQ